ncbi:glycoside hydrolase family 15 protein [Paracoccus marinaquae]|uniref:Glycoside hydrolase family 15 protein n=1 Tax=Paracoccus marinaquae TaxID=2841926 RepID=A0ABS6AI06_9RHOB|nr:glycoside hydrolase family 15 protein [Paracoccus marinaquae]MBU3029001.1 glycoside hydrolase family 15 protein [Paracoccus marinaquae]
MDRPDPGWIEAQRLASARAMRGACSATHLTRHREGFGWVLRPAPGSMLASPRMAAWDPEPDYFHHWIRDSAIVLRAVPLAIAAEPGARGFWLRHLVDFIRFSLAISDPERRGPARNPLRATVLPSHAQYLRPDAELAALTGAAWLEEPRVAADGAPDPEQWSRPQDDGPALRATAVMVVLDLLPEAARPEAEALVARDLAHTARIAGRSCIGPWEEAPPRRTTFTLLTQWDALDRACARDPQMREAADRIEALIAKAEDAATGGWRESVEAPEGRLDAATCLAILHTRRQQGPFAITAPRARATMAALEAIFAGLYPINRGRAVPAIGRWAGDVYCDGNPWYPTTLGYAELHYRIAAATADAEALAKAEAWMHLIQQVAPRPAGPLPEQFDRHDGAPVSCLDLAWSSSAFLEAAAARDMAIQALAGSR